MSRKFLNGVSPNPPVSIANGGTGATTAAGALTNLGAAYIVAESLGANGYRKWSDGYIEQWGYVQPSSGQGTVTFPIPFPNGLGGISFTANYTPSGATNAYSIWVSNAGLSGLTTQHRAWSTNQWVVDNAGAFWMATGR